MDLLAYNKLCKNDGILTLGETGQTADGMSLKRIDEIISNKLLPCSISKTVVLEKRLLKTLKRI